MNLKKFNYNHLYYFWMLSNKGTIKLASEFLFISASTLSDQIKVLENAVGEILFEKNGRFLKLTCKGLTLYQLVDVFFSTFAMEADLIFSFDNKKRSINIGVSTTLSNLMISEIVKTLIEETKLYPVIHKLESEELYKKSLSNGLDIVISGSDNLPESSNIQFKKYSLRKFCAVSSDPSLIQENIFPKNLDKKAFILYPKGHFLHQKLIEFFKKHQLTPIFSCETGDIDLILKLTLKGLGASILPYLSVKEYIERKELFNMGFIKKFSPYVYIGFCQKTFDPSFIQSAFNKVKVLQEESPSLIFEQ